MDVHLVDGTYELFRYYFALPSHVTDAGEEVAATRGVVGTVLQMLEEGATHVGVATDHIIESFRNDLWRRLQDAARAWTAELLGQFAPARGGARGAGRGRVADGRARGRRRAGEPPPPSRPPTPRVDRVLICTPDKDLGQCVGGKVVQLDRRKGAISASTRCGTKFGVPPESIPDYLGLVGDSADGFPGLPGWGAKRAAAVLARYGHLEAIPADVRRLGRHACAAAGKLAATLADHLDDAVLFRYIATTVADLPVLDDVASLRWTGPAPSFPAMCERLEAVNLVDRAARAAARV